MQYTGGSRPHIYWNSSEVSLSPRMPFDSSLLHTVKLVKSGKREATQGRTQEHNMVSPTPKIRVFEARNRRLRTQRIGIVEVCLLLCLVILGLYCIQVISNDNSVHVFNVGVYGMLTALSTGLGGMYLLFPPPASPSHRSLSSFHTSYSYILIYIILYKNGPSPFMDLPGYILAL